MPEPTVTPPPGPPASGMTVEFDYTNHRGETARRRVIPTGLRFAATEWHPDKQYLLDAYCLDRGAARSFALCDISGWSGVPDGGSDGGPTAGTVKPIVRCGLITTCGGCALAYSVPAPAVGSPPDPPVCPHCGQAADPMRFAAAVERLDAVRTNPEVARCLDDLDRVFGRRQSPPSPG